MTINEMAIPSNTDEQFMLKLLHNESIYTEHFYHNHSHSLLEIVLIKNGSGVYRVNKSKDYHFKAGDIFIFGCNEDHIVTNRNPRNGGESICIHFKPEFIWSPGNDLFDVKYLQAFYSRGKNFEHLLKAELPSTGIIKNIMYEIEGEFERQLFEYELMIKVKLLTILVEINRYFGDTAHIEDLNTISSRQLEQIEKTMRHIDYHINSDITLDSLAKIAVMSRSHYSRLFKALNGVSPWDYLLYKRIELAQRFLLNSSHPVTQIASECGFNNSANFNRSFKKLTGNTPTQFRRTGRLFHGSVHGLILSPNKNS